MNKKILSITTARKRLFNLAKEVQKPGTYFELTTDGESKMVCMSKEEFDSLMETLQIMEDPKIIKRIKEAQKEIAKGEFVEWENLKQEIGFESAVSRSLVVEDKAIKVGKKKGKKKNEKR